MVTPDLTHQLVTDRRRALVAAADHHRLVARCPAPRPAPRSVPPRSAPWSWLLTLRRLAPSFRFRPATTND